jgi:hypothetical protein
MMNEPWTPRQHVVHGQSTTPAGDSGAAGAVQIQVTLSSAEIATLSAIEDRAQQQSA